jgi:pimeloyl-ACP methyl ester carboxylesterase
MRTLFSNPLRIFATVPLLLLVCTTALAKDRTDDCRIGIYRLNDGSDVDIGATNGDHLRWRKEDGTTGALTKTSGDIWSSTLGWTKKPDGKRVSFDCGKGTITFAGVPGKRIPLEVTNTTFEGAGVKLAGRLILPQGNARVPIVVLVHGSEDFSARDFYSLQRQFPAEGIGAFVYDKRGTGKSGGIYTQNYLLLADDAIAAMNEAKRLARTRAGRVGYQGGSQAGWVIPLAAKIEPVDFAVVGYGLAVSPLDEDREAVALDLTDHGFGKDAIAKAREITDAVAAIIISGFRDGYQQFDAVKAKYAHEPWFKYVHGDITFFFLQNPEAKLREQGPVLLAGVPANHDPMPVLRNLDTPQLWILAADDHEAPSAETSRRLRSLQTQGKPITLAIFPRTEHGIYEYETKADGTRVDTRNPDGYFAMMRDFILRGRVDKQSYGTATIFRPTPVANANSRSAH